MIPARPPRTLDELATPSESQSPAVLRQYLSLESPQFSILELMLITAICAVTITLITAVGIYGAVGLFFGCFVTWWHLRTTMTDPTKLRFWNQFIWGILMPVGCIFGDPFVFGSFDNGEPRYFNEYAFACYAFIGWEIFCLAAGCFIRPAQRVLNQLLAGSLFAGAIFALLIAIAMIPVTLIGMMMLIGAVGLTPWFTANVYFRTARMHLQRARAAEGEGRAYFFISVGFLLAILVGVIVFVFTSRISTPQPMKDFLYEFTQSVL